MRQTLRLPAARIRPFLRALPASILFLSLIACVAKADTSSSSRQEQAKSQFDRAEKEREALEARPENSRTLKDYTSLVSTYKRVYLITPRAPEVPAALNAVAALYRAMGDLFSEKYYQSAVTSYHFLLKEYPTSHYREDALLAVAQIEQNDIHDMALAKTAYEQFLVLHPRSSHADAVRGILAKIEKPDESDEETRNIPPGKAGGKSAGSVAVISEEKKNEISPADATPKHSENFPESSTSGAPSGTGNGQVSRIRTWNADTYTRVVIDVGAQVKYQAARISGPDRIYFDIDGAKVNSALLHNPVNIEAGGFLKDVRVAQNKSGVVRIVLEVDRAKDYSVFLLPDPYRLIVDVYGTSAAAEQAARATAPAPGPTTEVPAQKVEKPARQASTKATAKPPVTIASATVSAPPAVEIAQAPKEISPDQALTPGPAAVPQAKKTAKDRVASQAKATAAADPASQSPKSSAASSDAGSKNLLAESDPPTLPATPAPAKKSVRPKKSAHDQAEEMGPATVPDLTRDGQHSLTRALGLKIGRIVIDAGHGGHDTGTIGPTGLMEKDLCLDVALRVGKLIRQRLPGADVVFTRDDDTFVPLERRTDIANDARADLFLSVHANSSQDSSARGIETYYLNFTGSSNAMEVAARENALSGNGVHDLEDLVSKIAKNEKIEESRDFAGIVQDSLSKRVGVVNSGDRNRGVRKAPFVVLIGANMPSVLAEISFISNPSDEQWLKKPENRQKVAEGLYRGIETYLQSTNSLANNQQHSSPMAHSAGIVARSGNSQ